MCVVSHSAAVVVDEDVSCDVVFDVCDLQAVGVPDLVGLEAGVDGVHFHNGLRFFSLQRYRSYQCFLHTFVHNFQNY